MNYVLKMNGTYEKEKILKESSVRDMAYTLIDISTDRKGPLYTMVRNTNFDFNKEDVHILMDVSYAPLDIPFDDFTLLHSNFNVSSLNMFYNVYPLIKQIFAFNTFREKYSIDNQIIIQNMQILYGSRSIDISEHDPDESIGKIFEKLKMSTNVESHLFDQLLILNNNKWSILPESSVNPYFWRFDKIGIPIPNTESLYLISYNDFCRFNEFFEKNGSIEIELMYKTEKMNDLEIFDEFDEEECISSIIINKFYSFLDACIFIPQMILMEQVIYKTDMRLSITVDRGHDIYTLRIDENEILHPQNTCLYHIIKKLLKM